MHLPLTLCSALVGYMVFGLRNLFYIIYCLYIAFFSTFPYIIITQLPKVISCEMGKIKTHIDIKSELIIARNNYI